MTRGCRVCSAGILPAAASHFGKYVQRICSAGVSPAVARASRPRNYH
jgi:hypothetical protein